MSGPRRSVLLGLVLLLVSMGPCRGSIESLELTDRQVILSLLLDLFQGVKSSNLEDSKSLELFSEHDSTLDEIEVTDYIDNPERLRAEIIAHVQKLKTKFIKHLTGPLYFNPKCSIYVHRIYHNTRDCTTPEQIVALDQRFKDKFIKHLTGPLYFSPKCNKYAHRIYHNTRDCTTPERK
ncbi:PREDICTED: protein FAM150B [Chrysochloris asiatica]|uniref:Protein FAM150B n=1 Tax=Chrysochloris asiatica TaxID=185453 RepID=A0A9B0WS23_CHRAS|nr:PREDICTED: protein FAM150B [Chrysochloris asiatica]